MIGLPAILPAARRRRLHVRRRRRGGGAGGRRAAPPHEIDAAASLPGGSRERSSSGLAAEIAARLERHDPGDPRLPTSPLPVARRWKTQINENAKHPAFSELPEADHNELEGWTDTDAGLLSAVFLEDADQPERERRRDRAHRRACSSDRRAKVVRVTTRGDTRTARLLWAVMLGDLVSLKLAARRGRRPEPVAVLDRIKSQL